MATGISTFSAGMSGVSKAGRKAARAHKKASKAQDRSRFCKEGFTYDRDRRICIKIAPKKGKKPHPETSSGGGAYTGEQVATGAGKTSF